MEARKIKMKYTVRAYLCTNFTGIMDDLETDNLYEAQDFIWENVHKGYNCELTNNETGEVKLVYAESFTEEAIDYNDLLMEQQEQM
jgi:hypothetical protein